MKSRLLFLASLLTFAAAERRTSGNNVPKNAILLSDVQSLTLRNGKMTTSRRASPVPQLTCTGPEDVCKLYQPDVMRCTNEGADYDAQNIQWSCRADLPEEFKLGSTEVICEGYASRDDDYVLKGSCGVEYRLLLTKQGEEVYGSQAQAHRAHETSVEFNGDHGGGGAGAVLFMVVFVAVLCFILVGMVNACRRNPPRIGGRGGNWGGGDDNDPPPPYDSDGYQPRSPPDYKRKTKTQGSSRTSTGGGSSRQRQDAWRPGPVAAGLAGAGLGYLAGRSTGSNRESSRRERPVAPSTPPSSSTAPSYSSSRYESTGFGGTSRR